MTETAEVRAVGNAIGDTAPGSTDGPTDVLEEDATPFKTVPFPPHASGDAAIGNSERKNAAMSDECDYRSDLSYARIL